MVLNGFDSVKVISMGNYSRRRKLKWLFEFFVFLFLVFHRSSLFSLAGPVIRHSFRRLVVVLNSHIFVFFVFHAMLFLVYTLSHLTDNKSGSNRTDTHSRLDGRPSHVAGRSPSPIHDSVDEILVIGEKNTAPAPASSPSSVDDSVVVGEKNRAPARSSSPSPVEDSVVEKNTAISPVNEASIDAIPVEETTTALSPAAVRNLNSVTEITPEIRRYRRTESERFEGNREMGKLRRSKTAIQWETGGEAERFLNSVEELDIDDFNRTVESFIAEQKLHIGGRISG